MAARQPVTAAGYRLRYTMARSRSCITHFRKYIMVTLRTTRSLCPVCLTLIDATIEKEDGKVYLRKTCKEHGSFQDLYAGDAALYERLMEHFATGSGVSNPLSEYTGQCARDCGLCNNHKSSPIIGIIDVTNRCNLDCTLCFASCNASRAFYEPSFEEIGKMMDTLLACNPPCPIVLFSGGEPTLREDFTDICNMAHQKGFAFIIVATNGKKLAADPTYHQQLADAHVDVIYLQFDGTDSGPYKALRGTDLYPLKMQALENIHNSPSPFPIVVLVPTIVKDVNDHQNGSIVRFASEHTAFIKGVLFQPVGFVGHFKNAELMEKRFTNTDGIHALADSRIGSIDPEDFYPVTWVRDFIEAFKRIHRKNNFIDLSIHPACFNVSYLLKTEDDLISLNKLVNLQELRNFVNGLQSGSTAELMLKFMKALPKLLTRHSYKMRNDLLHILSDILVNGSEKAIARFHEKNVLLVGFEHTSDPNNYDCQKVERCCIHYSVPGGNIIPFCSYNLLHRQRIEAAYARN